MPTKPPANDSTTFTDKILESAKAIPAQLKKFTNSMMGNVEVKPSPRPVAKPRKTVKKSRPSVTRARKVAKKK